MPRSPPCTTRRRAAAAAAGVRAVSARRRPAVSRWLGDIRRFFPTSVVQVIQRDAIERMQLQRLLLEPELLNAIEPDVHLVATLMELNRLLPDSTRFDGAPGRRHRGGRDRGSAGQPHAPGAHRRAHHAARIRRPRPGDVDWDRTIHANLRHYLPERRTIVPEHLIGYGRRQQAIAKELVLAIDQSGSMADSIVYAGVFASVLASLRSLRTTVVAFDTTVVDLSALTSDPVDVLFGVQLGGGTDIDNAIAYCEQFVTRPSDTVLVLLSRPLRRRRPRRAVTRMERLVRRGVTCIVLLALSDEGAPAYDHEHAAALADIGVVSVACTPDAFPDLLAAAMEGRRSGACRRRPRTRHRALGS